MVAEIIGGRVRVCAVVLRDASGSILTVRKQGTERFMLPGGKPEPGESRRETAVRECAEELGVLLDPAALREVGVFRAPAANEAGVEIEATVFEYPTVQVGSPASEIAELRWLAVSEQPLPADLAPLLSERVLPAIGYPPRALAARWMTVFTGSAQGVDPVYSDAVVKLAGVLAAEGVGLVYGGGKVGLMGQLADATLAAGGRAVGVMPQALVDGEIAHTGLTRLEVVPDMHERKLRMAELGDVFVALPGGAGTLEEFFEVWTWQQLGIHAKPVALYDVDGFWQPLLTMIDRMVDQGFLSARYRESLIVVRTPEDLLDAWAAWTPPVPKWTR
ncbi:TIGR00730 family Rossman fold protein [Plantactinospora mayteni]|uniref:TIGR00730 family Rossman fold protein n=1 Tax=Plantactinospora mayteni TaxID=566021 RepID=UPI0019433997|nr:TIGR00730 family Rossman fold protein [Plantactinospora mayteni]